MNDEHGQDIFSRTDGVIGQIRTGSRGDTTCNEMDESFVVLLNSSERVRPITDASRCWSVTRRLHCFTSVC